MGGFSQTGWIRCSVAAAFDWSPSANQVFVGRRSGMQFILAVILFVVVIGAIDAGLPWPRCGSGGARQ
jgi:hypothetical protein